MWKKIPFVLIFIFKWHAYIRIMKWTEMNSIYNNNFNEFQNIFLAIFSVDIRWSVYVKWIVESNHHQALVTIFDKKKIFKSKKNYYGQYKLLFKIHLMGNFIMYLLYHKKKLSRIFLTFPMMMTVYVCMVKSSSTTISFHLHWAT